ncbi:predicted protein [Naegleria gruberi]|uniref:Predicted protein n=1 Tax=Naegleria gruberi TaxID=5762 RepID=D2VHH3_NAEGR|nr:uncharacterized protein NAEGRDRAFT_68328 [Naegleria gruberi]EFC43680.1 predicted protein [Naegleria gruberi]|eukprot:XP_002676424.1 predicted protein [Naegleria gruberi strain NEG-M]
MISPRQHKIQPSSNDTPIKDNFIWNNYFGDALVQDMMIEIMEYCNDHLEILSSYCLISKTWFYASCLFRMKLDFSIKKIHPRYFESFFNASNVPRNITQLSLAFNALRDEQLIILSQCKTLTNLEHLNLRNNYALTREVLMSYWRVK